MENKIDNFDDNSKLWFGRYSGIELEKVPANYLFWWHNENKGKTLYGNSARLLEYIEENIEVLNNEEMANDKKRN